MRLLSRAVFVLIVSSFVACSQTTPAQPDSPQMASGASVAGANTGATSGATARASAGAPASGKPDIDPTWANGTLVYMIGPKLIVGARESMPNAYAKAEELYLIVFPQATLPAPGAGPITLPSGYQPNCNPCFHPGLPAPFVYHDHVITGAPGMGHDGTAGEFKAPWKIIIMMYDPHYAASPNFHPITSANAIDAAEQAGGVFLPFNQGAANPFELEPGNLLICPIVSKHA